ncbi:MAG: DUF1622 domain-containing protein [Deltaproteobacteria bacterium]|nr:DUF1622 domain-containing protein [Deltaproteobacteria bacterium]
MEQLFRRIASDIALCIEGAAVLIITLAALRAFGALLPGKAHRSRNDVFLRFGSWMLLGLEFELAADVLRTAIAPTWTQIGQLGAIAAIRTFLNYFLERDVALLNKDPSPP